MPTRKDRIKRNYQNSRTVHFVSHFNSRVGQCGIGFDGIYFYEAIEVFEALELKLEKVAPIFVRSSNEKPASFLDLPEFTRSRDLGIRLTHLFQRDVVLHGYGEPPHVYKIDTVHYGKAKIAVTTSA